MIHCSGLQKRFLFYVTQVTTYLLMRMKMYLQLLKHKGILQTNPLENVPSNFIEF